MAKSQKSTPDAISMFASLAQSSHEPSVPLGIPAIAQPHDKISLDAIQDRAEDTRQLNESHVNALAESIAVLGLIEPLVTDKNYVLLAGGHRKAAIVKLKTDRPSDFHKHFPEGMVPVRIIEFDAGAEPSRALEIEIAENEQRRDYSPSEVRMIAERLRELGYKDNEGRPKAGEKRLRPALSVIVGKSERTVRRYLNNQETRTDGQVNEVEKKRTNGQVFLKKAIANLKKWEQHRGRKRSETELSKNLPEILEKLQSAIEKME